ncbi:MAG: M23 family metallopeptidase [Coleofasciculaceae cyanobacterium RL_1_1]|nr:M23 family metallopeptidase [Coleofasciculaceae cyanobacterium RL_1_1]
MQRSSLPPFLSRDTFPTRQETRLIKASLARLAVRFSLFGLWLTLAACNGVDPSSKADSHHQNTELSNEETATSSTSDRAQVSIAVASEVTPEPPISLSIPIDCQLGDDCFVLLYPDTDPGSGIRDSGCGQQTYDTHKGTDFAVPSLADLDRGVNVLASADGTVLRLRDGVPDRRLRTTAEIEAIAEQGIECGNGIVIDHGNGWTGQYCHLEQGSVAVGEGDRVQRGDVIGRVGVSGKTTFPHVHLTLRYNDEVIDPYSGQPTAAGCTVDRQPLWSEALDYTPSGIVRIGFADRPPTIDGLWDGEFTAPQIDTKAEVLLFWVHYYGAQVGDIERYRLVDAAGRVVTEYEQEIKANQVNGMSYVGKRNTPQNPIKPGTWRGEYSLVRDGQTIASEQAEINVRSAN